MVTLQIRGYPGAFQNESLDVLSFGVYFNNGLIYNSPIFHMVIIKLMKPYKLILKNQSVVILK